MGFLQKTATATGAFVTTLQSAAFPAPVATGSDIVVGIATYNANTITSVTDTAGNTYTQDKSFTNPGDTSNKLSLWRATNVTGGSTFKVTANASGGVFISFSAVEFTQADPNDTTGSSAGGTGTSAAPGSFTTGHADDVIFALVTDPGGGNQSYTDPAGYTNVGQNIDGNSFVHFNFAFGVVAAAGAQNPATTQNSANWAAIGYAYEVEAAGGGGPFPWFVDDALNGGMHSCGMGW